MRKLKNYKPTQFMAKGSVYDKAAADHAVAFIESLCHTKGEWAGKPFDLIDWQEQIIRDIFGVLKADGYRQFNTAYIQTSKKAGKQLSVVTLIPTPNGFTTMGDIAVGDIVFDDRGKPCKVVAKSAIDYDEAAYRITFKDGETIEAGANHQWVGEYLSSKKNKQDVVNTRWLYKRAMRKSAAGENSVRFRINVAEAIETENANLVVDPYLYGYWLGNGTARSAQITIKNSDVEAVLEQIKPYHSISRIWDNVGDSKIVYIPDLCGVRLESFHDKVIPQNYLRGSREQRLRLLQGLMDSDGCINPLRGQAIYCSTEKALSESVSELLWSLGIKNAITSEASMQRADWSKPSRECGRVCTGETLYNVKFTAFDDMRIAGLDRKQSKAAKRNPRTRSHYRYIDKIEPITNPGMQCIQVNSPSHQYLVGRSFLPTHNSELAAAVALYMLCADGEISAEVYGCANDRRQASIIFDVARDMVLHSSALMKRCKILDSTKRIVYQPTRSFYQAMSAEVSTKYGLSVSCCLFDELLGQPDRKLFDVMTKGSGAARTQPLNFVITTAGNDTSSICYEVYSKAKDIIEGRKYDPSFYPAIFSASDDADWSLPATWRAANPSLGITVKESFVRQMYESARQNPSEENQFRQFMLNQWVKQSTRWMPMHVWDECAFPVNPEALKGRICYGGLDLSSTTDITAFVLVFPPQDEDDKYAILPYFWIPEDTIPLRVKRDHVMYDLWVRQGHMTTTEGNVVHYGYIEKFIEDLGKKYNIASICYDRWGAVQMSQNLEGMGFSVIPFGQGFKDMSPPTKELMKLTLEKKLAHGGHPVLRWMMDNVFIRKDPAGNEKPDKEKSTEKIDGVVATVMALDRAIRCGNVQTGSVYDRRGIIYI